VNTFVYFLEDVFGLLYVEAFEEGNREASQYKVSSMIEYEHALVLTFDTYFGSDRSSSIETYQI
jgi:hypothetical protein